MSHYAQLGVPATASAEEIDAAYARLRAYLDEEAEAIGDGSGLIVAQTTALDEAYRVLSDPARRRAYDSGEGAFCAACYHALGGAPSRCPRCGQPTGASTGAVARPEADTTAPGAADAPLASTGQAPGPTARPARATSGNGGRTGNGPPQERTAAGAALEGMRLAWVVWGAAVVAVAVVVFLVAQGLPLGGGGETSEEPAPEQVSSRLSEWAPELRPLVGFVERAKGLPFRHAVEVQMLGGDEFQAALRAAREELTDEEREGLGASSGVLRALGLFDGDYDPLAHLEDPTQAVLGFYDPDDGVIRVASTELDLFSEVTVVHELTHALQDQYFDLARLSSLDDDGKAAMLRSLAEGDATRVERRYLEMFNAEEVQGYLDAGAAYWDGLEEADGGGADVPEVYSTFMLAPYVLGDVFVEVVAAARGEEAIDAAFRELPGGEEHILDPWLYIDGKRAVDVDPPELQPGDREIARGELGALTWYLVLGERIDLRAALLAFDGFAGDAYATFERAGRVCIAARFQGDTNGDNLQMLDALHAWQAAMPAGAVTVQSRGATIDFESCDPGPGAAPTTGRGEVALLVPAVRSVTSYLAIDAGATVEEARCVAAKTLEGRSSEELIAMGLALIEGDPAAIPIDVVFDEGCLGADGPGGG